jgi:hypothetical protein
VADVVKRLVRLQELRGRLEPDTSIRGLLESIARDARRTNDRLGSLIDLWEELVPPRLAGRCRVASLRRGIMRVEADSAATAFELDRLLRGGLEQSLRVRFGATLRSVRVSATGPGPA